MTPYGSDRYVEAGTFFSRHGYTFVIVDVRGRGNSEGRFRAMVQESSDVSDVIDWIAEQPWCNGSLGMWGGSYAGYSQWVAARSGHDALKTIVPVSAAFPGVDIPFWRNIVNLYEFQWQALTYGVSDNSNLANLTDYWKGAFFERYEKHLPFSGVPEIAGYPDMPLDWMDFPHPCAYWDEMTPTDAEFANIDIPVLSVTGHYDADQPGAMEFYRRHMRHGAESATGRHHLIIGPWDHAGTRNPKREIGGVEFGDASMVDMNELQLQWFDWTLRDGRRPGFLKDRIAYYVTGSEKWVYARSLKEIGTGCERRYLDSTDGRARNSGDPGRLVSGAPTERGQPDRFRYDPLDTRQGHWELTADPDYLTNGEISDALFENGAVYQTEPLIETMEIAGCPKLTVWMSLNVPDTDFEVVVAAVLPDGGSIVLSRDLQRARYRKSLRSPEAVSPGAVLAYEFTGFSFIARRLDKGSRIRLTLRCPNSIYLQKNYNSGGIVAHECGDDAQVAEVTVFHDPDHASFLELPVNR
jgi:putative CocE/NonD family hydrolase